MTARRPALPPRARKLPASPYFAAPLPRVRGARRSWHLYAPDGALLGHALAVSAFRFDACLPRFDGTVIRAGSLRDAAAELARRRP